MPVNDFTQRDRDAYHAERKQALASETEVTPEFREKLGEFMRDNDALLGRLADSEARDRASEAEVTPAVAAWAVTAPTACPDCSSSPAALPPLAETFPLTVTVTVRVPRGTHSGTVMNVMNDYLEDITEDYGYRFSDVQVTG